MMPHTSKRNFPGSINPISTTATFCALSTPLSKASFFITEQSSSHWKTSAVTKLADGLKQVEVAKIEKNKYAILK